MPFNPPKRASLPVPLVNPAVPASPASVVTDPGSGDFAHGIVGGIGNIDVPSAVHRSSIRIVKDGLASGPVSTIGVAGEGIKIVWYWVVALRLRAKGDQ